MSSQEQPVRRPLIAYITESRDREYNVFFVADICDSERHEIVKELTGYDREALETEVLQEFPDIEIENG